MSNSAFGPVVLGQTHSSNVNVSSSKDEHNALGLKAIYAACRTIYPDQPTPLQVTAVRKFWMGGPDPLDFINMYANAGSNELNSASHWHYVTNGLSDLYGDSRLHSHSSSTDGPSGFGFELTFRVKREANETNPPTWPAHLLQSLARYVFYSQAQLMSGDHIPWPTALDKQPNLQEKHSDKQNSESISTSADDEVEQTRRSIAMAAAATAASILAANSSKTGDASLNALTNPSTYASMVAAALAAVNSSAPDGSDCKTIINSANPVSRIRHMLLVEDPQLKKISTAYGYVQFLQIVGLCDEELRLVQRWTGSQVAGLMSRLRETGGELLVTDMRRRLSIFELQPNLVDYINEKLRREGSNLSGVTTAYFAWAPITIATLNELLPGEIESRRLRRQAQKRNSLIASSSSFPALTTIMASPSNFQSSAPFTKAQASSKQMLFSSFPDTVKPEGTLSSIKPAAMDTDDTVVSFSPKKQVEDDEFVDVVGDGTCHRPSQNSLIPSPIASMSEEPSMLKMSRFGPKCKLVSHMKSSLSHLNPDSHLTNSPIMKSADGQTISAPGGFSAWCSRAGPLNFAAQSQFFRQNVAKTAESSPGASGPTALIGTPNELNNTFSGALGFRTFNSETVHDFCEDKLMDINENKGTHTPGSTGDGSAPCTPLAHLSLSPASLDLMPTRIIDYLDVHLCREAGEMLPLAVNDRLRHGRHFTFLNASYPDHAITLVPSGVSGSFVTEETPYVARGPWLQILLTEDFLEQLEFQFSCLLYPDEIKLPLVFRWPERHLRICLVDANANLNITNLGSNTPQTTSHTLLPKAAANINLNWNIPSPVTSKLNYSGSSTILRSTSSRLETNLSNTNSESTVSPLLSLFPPGCIPPPNVLAAIVNVASNAYQAELRDKSYHHQSTPNQTLFNEAKSDVDCKSGSVFPDPTNWLNSFQNSNLNRMDNNNNSQSKSLVNSPNNLSFPRFIEMMQAMLGYYHAQATPLQSQTPSLSTAATASLPLGNNLHPNFIQSIKHNFISNSCGSNLVGLGNYNSTTSTTR